jgi:hypothetical protein
MDGIKWVKYQYSNQIVVLDAVYTLFVPVQRS